MCSLVCLTEHYQPDWFHRAVTEVLIAGINHNKDSCSVLQKYQCMTKLLASVPENSLLVKYDRICTEVI